MLFVGKEHASVFDAPVGVLRGRHGFRHTGRLRSDRGRDHAKLRAGTQPAVDRAEKLPHNRERRARPP